MHPHNDGLSRQRALAILATGFPADELEVRRVSRVGASLASPVAEEGGRLGVTGSRRGNRDGPHVLCSVERKERAL